MTKTQKHFMQGASAAIKTHQEGYIDAYDINDVLEELVRRIEGFTYPIYINPLYEDADFLAGFSIFIKGN